MFDEVLRPSSRNDMVITQRDIIDTITGLHQEARALRSAAETPPIPDMPEPVVVVKVSGLLATAEYLEQVAAELAYLITDQPLKAREDPPSSPEGQ